MLLLGVSGDVFSRIQVALTLAVAVVALPVRKMWKGRLQCMCIIVEFVLCAVI